MTSLSPSPTSLIHDKLRAIEQRHAVRVIYACESGSRAWGFASEDSDYDVRFLYVRAPQDYLSVRDQRDNLEFGVDAHLLDFAGWDLRKALRLFAKSNGALLEWLHSPDVYRQEDETMQLWRALVPDVLSPKGLAGHYLGMARKTWLGSLQSPRVRLKSYLYALRAVLAARWVLQRRLPAPVRFERLLEFSSLDEGVRSHVVDQVDAKRKLTEADTMNPDPLLQAFIESELATLSLKQIAMPSRVVNLELVDAFFQQVVLGA